MLDDSETLLKEIKQEPPCGPNLEYAPEFIALEQAASGKPERQIGDRITPAEPPDWEEVKRQAEALFSRTRDLRVAVLLARALTRIDDLAGLRAGLKLIFTLLDRNWDDVHPRLDPEDGDPTVRLNALAALADSDGLLRDARQAFIVRPGRHGRVSVREMLVAAGKLPAAAGETAPGQTQVEAIVRAAAAENIAPIAAVRESAELVRAIHRLLSDKVGSDRVPDLRPLTDTLGAAAQFCSRFQNPDQPPDVSSGGAEEARPPTALGAIGSREDAIRALDAVCEFFERAEPANPAPLLIRRAQRLIKKSFVEIIEDLAPESLGQIRNIAGIQKEPE